MAQKTKTQSHPKTLRKISQRGENHPSHATLASVRQALERLYQKFSVFVDLSIFKELDRLVAILEEDFIRYRSVDHLTRLAYSIALIRRKLSQGVTLLPLKEHYDLRLVPFSLQFTFGSKPVLGILAHAYLRDKYEAFDEEHILLSLRKSVSEAQLVNGSIYTFQSSNGIKTLYFEIDKKSGLPFSSEEIHRLKKLLKQEIKFCVEQLVPRIFMARNEEEVLRNILTLSREIHSPSDIPQVIILLDRQTSQEAIFTIILVRACQKQEASISTCFAAIQANFTYFPERCQIVRHLEQYPIEANVFRISLPKDTSLLRTDLSLNFYLARQKISSLLVEAIGEFRDYNGGIIIKQRERLTLFMESFPELSIQNSDLLESFFYSLSPIEVQGTLPLVSLNTLFQLFLDALCFNITKPSDYFYKFIQNDDELFLMVRIPDKAFKEKLDSLLLVQSLIVTSTLHLQNTDFLGYLISVKYPDTRRSIEEAVAEALIAWEQRVKSRKILKLGLEHSILSLDPRIGGDQSCSLLLKMLFEGLMRENREGKIEYGLAQSVEISSDLKVYLFKLRQSRWSNGSLVTAFDFEYSWKKVLSPTFKTPYAYLFYSIKNAQPAKKGRVSLDAVGVQALDDLTLKVELKSPTPYFLELIAHTIFSPTSRLIDQLHPNWPLDKGSSYICNGAFQLVKNQPNQGYELVRNPLYWDANNIRLEQAIVLKMNRHQAFEMFQKDENHWIGGPLLTWEPNLFIPNENDELIDFLHKSVYWYNFNSSKPPFSHKKLRQAFSLAINRQQLALIFDTESIFSPLPIPHSLIKQPTPPSYNPKQAKQLFDQALKELALSREDFPVLTLIHLAGTIRNKIAEKIQHFWESTFGIECRIEPLEWSALFKKITEGDYQVGAISWQAWVNDPLYTLNAFRDANDLMNFPKWESPKFQEILNLAEKETDTNVRQRYCMQAEEILLEELPVAPILAYPSRALKKKDLILHCSSQFINLKWAYFQPLH